MGIMYAFQTHLTVAPKNCFSDALGFFRHLKGPVAPTDAFSKEEEQREREGVDERESLARRDSSISSGKMLRTEE